MAQDVTRRDFLKVGGFAGRFAGRRGSGSDRSSTPTEAHAETIAVTGFRVPAALCGQKTTGRTMPS